MKKRIRVGPTLAYLRPSPVSADRTERLMVRLRLSKAPWASEAMAVIQAQARRIVAMDNELGEIYEEGNQHAA